MTTVTSLGSNSSSSSQSTVTIITSGTVTSGRAIFVTAIIASLTVEISSITDTASNTYTRAKKATHNGSSYGVEIWHCLASSGLASGGVITVHLNGNAVARTQASGLDGAATLSDSGASTGASMSPSASTGASVADGSVLFGAMITDGSVTTITQPGGIWSSDYNQTDFASSGGVLGAAAAHGLKSGGGTGTYNPTLNKSGNWACVVAAYASGSASVPASAGWAGLLF